MRSRGFCLPDAGVYSTPVGWLNSVRVLGIGHEFAKGAAAHGDAAVIIDQPDDLALA